MLVFRLLVSLVVRFGRLVPIRVVVTLGLARSTDKFRLDALFAVVGFADGLADTIVCKVGSR